MVDLKDGRGEIDDIDHLGNRRVRSVGGDGKSISCWPAEDGTSDTRTNEFDRIRHCNASGPD